MRSTAERVDAARAGATLAEQRFDAEQRRYDVGLSTTFLVTQAQRDLLQAQVNLLQTMLDYRVGARELRGGAAGAAARRAARRSVCAAPNIVLLPTPTPRGIFRPGAGQ